MAEKEGTGRVTALSAIASAAYDTLALTMLEDDEYQYTPYDLLFVIEMMRLRHQTAHTLMVAQQEPQLDLSVLMRKQTSNGEG